MNKPATWAQAVQPKGPVSNAAVEQNLVVDATAKSVGILAETVNCDKVIGRSDLPESEEEEVENKEEQEQKESCQNVNRNFIQ